MAFGRYRYRPMARMSKQRAALAPDRAREYENAMMLFFDIDDRSRLPWRFHGLGLTLTREL
jgi:hypothetical protein